MLNFPTNVRIFFATQPTDLRRSYDGLSAMVDGSFGSSSSCAPSWTRVLAWARERIRARAG